MSQEKTCVIIDDENQEEIFNKQIRDVLKIEGYRINLIFIHAANPIILNADNDIDENLLTKYIIQEIGEGPVNVVATDFDLSDKAVCGIDVVKIIRNLRAKVPIVLYSGKREAAIKSVIYNKEEAESGNIVHTLKTEADLINDINKFMSLNITEFVERKLYTDKINYILKKKDNSIEYILPNALREYAEDTFQFGYTQFQGKKLKEIASEIEKETYLGSLYQKELLDQTIAHLIEINKN